VRLKPEIISHEVAKLRCDDRVSADIQALDSRIVEVDRRRTNRARRVAAIDDDETVAPLLVEMKQLSEQMSRLQVDRPELESEPKSWEIVERCLNDLEYWCETQAKNLAELDYDQKRLALFALKLKARVWRSDHDPRFENKMRIDVANEDRSGHAIVDTTPRRGGCTPRCRRARPPSEAGSRARSRPRDRRRPRGQAPRRQVAAHTRSAARGTSATAVPLWSFQSP
jgi:hypothetical protein